MFKMHQNTKLKGFLLSRNWRDGPNGIDLDFWISTKQGPAHIIIKNQQAVCFIERKKPLELDTGIERKSLQLNTLKGQPVDGLYFKQQRKLTELRERLSLDKSILCESEIKPNDRYLMERFITATLSVEGEATQKAGYLEFINPLLKPADFDASLRCASIDIETEDVRGKLYSIAVTLDNLEQVFMVKNPSEFTKGSDEIAWCENETEAIQTFFRWLKKHDPDVIIGWNVVAFDLDFLQWKCKTLNIPFDLGRGENSHSAILVPQQSGHMHIARIPGRVVLDGITSLRGAFWNFESFALDFVAEQLLGKKKLINQSGKQKLAEIQRQYHEDPVSLANYNLEDCRLVDDIFKKTDLLNFSIQRAQMTGLAIDRQGGSSAAFDNLYLPRLHRKGFVAPDIGSQQFDQHSPGGYVMDSQPGLYENVLVLDFKSLYPSIIRTFKIDPMGLALGEKEDDPIPGFLDAQFSREKHILPDIVSNLWQKRDIAKHDNNKPLSQAIKIIMNSFYGVLGSSGCRFFNPQLASSITKRGHEIIQKSKEFIEAKGYPVIYGDTDSVFVLIGEGQDEKQCQAIGKQLQDSLNNWWNNSLKEKYQIESSLEIEFETHYLRFLMPTIRGAEKGSKKRYAGMVNKQGEQHMVFKGLETVRTDWTPLAREFQQKLYQLIFLNKPYRDFILQTFNELNAGNLDNKLVYTKRLRRPLASYTSTQPPQVKAARKMKNPGRKIQYLITLNGPEPTENIQSRPDYQHYVDKQLAPVADSILYFLDDSFEKITARQLDVFG